MAAVIAKSEGRKSPYRIASAFIVSVGLAIGAGVSPAFADDAPDTDPDAHQVFQAPADEATVDALSAALKNLAVKVENETQLSKKIDTLGEAAGVAAGKVKDLEGDSVNFGGWKAIDGGKFAVAKQSDAGVFPFTTVNETCSVNSGVCELWRQENSVDETFKHALFLSQVRTEKTKDEESFANEAYVHTGKGNGFAAGIKGYNGIQKTFKAYSPDLGSRLKVSFTTGYTGDIEGKKANYKVEVTYKEGDAEKTVYTASFDPSKSAKSDTHTVLAAQDGTQQKISNVQGKSDEEIQTLLDGNKPNGRPGTFTSKEIELPKGVTEYTVKISSADNMHLGMSYQSKHEQYALPVVGKDFSISQDTKSVAKSLLKKIHAKLDASKAETTAKKTDASVKKYTDELAKVAELVKDEKELQENSVYTAALDAVLAAKEALASTETPAIAAVTDLAEQKVEEISANSSLNDEEKASAKKRVNDEKEKAIKAIKEAADNAGVTKAKDAGIAAIAAVNPVGKESAKAEVRAALEKKLAELDDNKLLSEAERKAAKDQAQAKADAAVGEIDKQPSSAASADEAKKAQDAVNAAKDAGIAAIAAVNPVGKESAKAEVRAALEKKLAELDDNKLLSEAERKAAKDQAQAKADAAVGEIDKQPSSAASADEAKKAQDAVNAAKDKGIADVMSVNPVGKESAKAEVRAALEKKLAELDDNKLLSEAERKAAKDQAQAKADAAVGEIDKQPSSAASADEAKKAQDAVNAAKDKGIADVMSVNPVGKESAKAEVRAALEKKLAELDDNKLLSEAERKAAKDQAQAKADAAVGEIDKQPSSAASADEAKKAQDAVNAAKDKGIADVMSVNPVGKESAKAEVRAALEKKLAELDDNKLLSEAERKAAKDQAQAKADAAVGEIDKQPSSAASADEAKKAQDAVNAAKDKGIADVMSVNPVGKESAKAEVRAALEKKLAELDDNKLLSEAERKAAKDQAQAKADAAVGEIDKQPSSAASADEAKKAQDAVNAAKDKGIADVMSVNPVGKKVAKEPKVAGGKKLSNTGTAGIFALICAMLGCCTAGAAAVAYRRRHASK